MTLAGRAREIALARSIRARAEEYRAAVGDAERAANQLRLLNVEWQRTASETPYFERLVATRRLPKSFDSLAHFFASAPPTTRESVQEHGSAMRSSRRAADVVRMTGGSTSEPVQIPSWTSEAAETAPNMWWGRSWYGIKPSSRLFLLWGHSHLLGTGVRGWLRARRLEFSDRSLGYLRFSAYDLRREILVRAAGAMIRFRPEYVIGYSVALDLFARTNPDVRRELRALGVKAVIGTAESFPSNDSQEILGDLFGCPVAMEYGAVETGLVAHTEPGGGYRVFWRQYLVETESGQGNSRMRVTSLYPRCFPLVRYEIGDEVVVSHLPQAHAGLASFERVIGRCNDYVPLADGAMIHSEVFSHALRPCTEIHGFQVVHGHDGILIRVVTPTPLPPERIGEIRSRLGKAHPDLAAASFERVERLDQTVAGKTRMVVRS